MKDIKKIIICIVYTIIGLFSTGIVRKIVPNSYFNEYFETLSYIFPLLFVLVLIKKNSNFQNVFIKKYKFFQYLKYIYPVYIIIIMDIFFKILPAMRFELKNKYVLVFLNLIFLNFFVSLFEEMLFRNIVLNTIFKSDGNIKKSAIISSLLFSLFHIGNITIENMSFSFVFTQIIYTFMLGIFFSGLYFYFQNIGLCILSHFLIDFFSYVDNLFVISSKTVVNSINLISFLVIIISVIPCFLYGDFLIKKSKSKEF